MAEPIIQSFSVETNVELSVWPGDTLPPLPEGVEPEVSFSFDDGRLITIVTLAGEWVKFWSTEYDGTYNEDQTRNVWPALEEEDREMLLEWGKEVHERLDAATYRLMLDASYAPGIPEILIKYATTSNPEEE